MNNGFSTPRKRLRVVLIASLAALAAVFVAVIASRRTDRVETAEPAPAGGELRRNNGADSGGDSPLAAGEAGFRNADSPADSSHSVPETDPAPAAWRVTVSGRAFDTAFGRGVGGIVVTGIADEAAQTTEEDGFFEVAAMAEPDGVGYLAISVPPGWIATGTDGEGRIAFEAERGETAARAFVALKRAAPLDGIVLLPDGTTPAAGAAVSVSMVRAETLRTETRVAGHATVSDERGVFRTSLYPAARNRIEARMDDMIAVETITTDESLEPVETVLVLQRSASVTGTVTTPGGAPAPGVRVLVLGTGRGGEAATARALTNEKGAYEVRGVTPGDVEVSLDVPPNSGFFAPDPVRLTLAGGQGPTDVDFVLSEGDAIEGYVYGRDSQPLEGATIAGPETLRLGANPWSPQYQPGWADAEPLRTDANGYFRVAGVPPWGTLPVLTVSHPEYISQTRRNLTMLDGVQRFRLTMESAVTLTALWEEDRSPVTFYAYRLLRAGWNDFQYETGHNSIDVFAADGRTEIADIEPGEYTAEVTVLRPDGSLSDLRDSVAFEIEAGGERQDLELLMSGGFFVSGVVLRMPDGAPVGNATVRFVPPSIDWRRPVFPSSDAFRIGSTTTEGDGSFEFVGVPPGRYTLVAEAGELRMKIARDFEVGTTPPPHQRLEVWDGAAILGYVTGPDGTPLAGTRTIHQEHGPNTDHWVSRESRTDADGFYNFVGVQGGSHFVTVSEPRLGLTDRRSVDVQLGEEARLDFDFSDGVTLTGTVRVNGHAPGSRQMSVYLAGADGSFSDLFNVEPDGRYAARVRPGLYNVLVQSGSVQGEGEEVAVSATPAVQTRDIDIDIVPADIVIEFPEGEEFQPGHVVIAPRDMKAKYRYIRHEAQQENRHLPEMLGGDYIASFTSEDGDWQGDSDWVALRLGADNVFFIQAERLPRTARIGGWTRDGLTLQFQPYRFDITSFASGAATYEVIVDYERGRHAVVIDRVALLENGRVVAEDVHEGWSGFDKIGTRYSLPFHDARSNAILTVEVTMRCDGGTDSEGSVYLRVR